MMQYRKKTETIEAIQFHKIEEDFAALKALVEKAVGWGLDVQVYASGATPTVRLLSSFGPGFQVREGDYVFLRDGRLEVWSKGKFEEKFDLIPEVVPMVWTSWQSSQWPSEWHTHYFDGGGSAYFGY